MFALLTGLSNQAYGCGEADIHQSGPLSKQTFVKADIHQSGPLSKQTFVETDVCRSRPLLMQTFIEADLCHSGPSSKWTFVEPDLCRSGHLSKRTFIKCPLLQQLVYFSWVNSLVSYMKLGLIVDKFGFCRRLSSPSIYSRRKSASTKVRFDDCPPHLGCEYGWSAPNRSTFQELYSRVGSWSHPKILDFAGKACQGQML